MARDVNFFVITGRVIAPGIELRKTKSGKPVADFKIVSNSKQLPADDPDRLKFALFMKVTLWGDDALFWSGQGSKIIDPLGRGDEVHVQGRLVSDDFCPKDGDVRTSGRVRIDQANIKLLKRSRRNEEEPPVVNEE
jgi:single-stranded DNA-binding protein